MIINEKLRLFPHNEFRNIKVNGDEDWPTNIYQENDTESLALFARDFVEYKMRVKLRKKMLGLKLKPLPAQHLKEFGLITTKNEPNHLKEFLGEKSKKSSGNGNEK